MLHAALSIAKWHGTWKTTALAVGVIVYQCLVCEPVGCCVRCERSDKISFIVVSGLRECYVLNFPSQQRPCSSYFMLVHVAVGELYIHYTMRAGTDCRIANQCMANGSGSCRSDCNGNLYTIKH